MGKVGKFVEKLLDCIGKSLAPTAIGLFFIGAIFKSLLVGIIVGIIVFTAIFIDSWNVY